jgi:hypothetical protein
MVKAYTRVTGLSSLAIGTPPNPGKPLEHMNCQEYNQEAVREKIQHAVSVLIETEAVRAVGGFDETLTQLGGLGFLYQACG